MEFLEFEPEKDPEWNVGEIIPYKKPEFGERGGEQVYATISSKEIRRDRSIRYSLVAHRENKLYGGEE